MDNSLKVLNRNQLLQVWSERVKDCRSSGLPVRNWCKANNVKVSTYYSWQKRLFNIATGEATAELCPVEDSKDVPATKLQFAEIKTENISPESKEVLAATIVVGKTSIDIYNDIHPALLQIIMRGLK